MLNPRLPGWVATSLIILTTSLWTFWGISELYYEGWGLPFPQPLAYLIPAAICLAFALLALGWPRLGGWLLMLGGTAFTIWWWGMAWRRFGGPDGTLTPTAVLSTIPLSAFLILTGGLFLLEARYRRNYACAGVKHKTAVFLVLGVPLAIVLLITALQLPPLLRRYDDGERGLRRITAPGVDLLWAPQGPGWNWQQPWGGYPSWNALALYGRSPLGLAEKSSLTASAEEMQMTGLCAYLSPDGLTLGDTPQYLWRMPTVAELVRSLTRNGRNAGCIWQGNLGPTPCTLTPDKETPLWNPDAPPIYYWAADELNAQEAFYVNYRGVVSAQPKSFGNPRHGYRCVRAP